MESLPGSEFSHRSDLNGVMVSTCNTCFAAVAVSLRQAELEEAERAHRCNPQTLEHWKMFIHEIKRGDRKRPQSQSV